MFSTRKVKEKFWNFVHRTVSQSRAVTRYEQWEEVLFPVQEGNSYTVKHVFRRSYLQNRSGLIATVIYDERASRVRLGPTLRVRCMSCAGAASNRLLCIHEKVCLELVQRNSDSLTKKACFESSCPRKIFACRWESDAILNVICSTHQNIKESDGEIDTRLYSCSGCGFVNTVSKRILVEESVTRETVLHTLHHGSMKIQVVYIS